MDIEQIIQIIVFALSGAIALIGFIVALVRGKSASVASKEAKEIFEQMSKLLIRDRNYRNDGKTPEAQTFSNLVPEYELDEEKNVLVQVGEVDIQKEIDSFKSCALKQVLAKYLPEEEQEEQEEAGIRERLFRNSSPADDMLDVCDFADDIRERYGMPSDLGYAEVFEKLEDMVMSNKKSIEEVIKNAQKEQTQIVEESKPTDVSVGE